MRDFQIVNGEVCLTDYFLFLNVSIQQCIFQTKICFGEFNKNVYEVKNFYGVGGDFKTLKWMPHTKSDF